MSAFDSIAEQPTSDCAQKPSLRAKAINLNSSRNVFAPVRVAIDRRFRQPACLSRHIPQTIVRREAVQQYALDGLNCLRLLMQDAFNICANLHLGDD